MTLLYESITREISPTLTPGLFLVREQRRGKAPELYRLVPQEVEEICHARRFQCAHCGRWGDPLQGCSCGSNDWVAEEVGQ